MGGIARLASEEREKRNNKQAHGWKSTQGKHSDSELKRIKFLWQTLFFLLPSAIRFLFIIECETQKNVNGSLSRSPFTRSVATWGKSVIYCEKPNVIYWNISAAEREGRRERERGETRRIAGAIDVNKQLTCCADRWMSNWKYFWGQNCAPHKRNSLSKQQCAVTFRGVHFSPLGLCFLIQFESCRDTAQLDN